MPQYAKKTYSVNLKNYEEATKYQDNRGKTKMVKILFICHGSILRSLEKACYINDFHRSNGAYYTTITPFVEEL